MSKPFVLVHAICEGADERPVAVHLFFGDSPEECKAVHRAHLIADAFLRGCEQAGHYQTIPCHCRMHGPMPTGEAWPWILQA